MPSIRFISQVLTQEAAVEFFSGADLTRIQTLAGAWGYPLRGIFIVPAGGVLPSFIKHVSEFPVQTGSVSQRANKLQVALESEMQSFFEESTPEGEVGRSFWCAVHVWNYVTPLSGMKPRSSNGSGDYLLHVSDSTPPANWWQKW